MIKLHLLNAKLTLTLTVTLYLTISLTLSLTLSLTIVDFQNGGPLEWRADNGMTLFLLLLLRNKCQLHYVKGSGTVSTSSSSINSRKQAKGLYFHSK